MKYIYKIFLDNTLPSLHLNKILTRFQVVDDDTEGQILLCLLHMLCDFYVDKNEADNWASLYFKLIKSKEGEEIISKYENLKYIASYY